MMWGAKLLEICSLTADCHAAFAPGPLTAHTMHPITAEGDNSAQNLIDIAGSGSIAHAIYRAYQWMKSKIQMMHSGAFKFSNHLNMVGPKFETVTETGPIYKTPNQNIQPDCDCKRGCENG